MEVCVGVGIGLFLDNLVPRLPCVNGQKVDIELEHVLSGLITFGLGFLCGLHGLLKLSHDVVRREVELVELASTIVYFDFYQIFWKFQKFHPVPLAGLLAA